MIRQQLIEDKDLVKQYLHGEETALEIIVNRYKDKIFSAIFFMVKDRELAEDIFQDTFVKVINTLRSGKYKEEGKFLPWIMRIAHNLCIDHFRKKKKMSFASAVTEDGTDVFDFLEIEEENIEDKWIWEQTADKVRRLINELPHEQKEVVVMRHYGELSFKEIAQLTGVSINTALGRMRYALQNMRKVIEEKEVNL